jgi:anthranilate phosphoribosyltransferase
MIKETLEKISDRENLTQAEANRIMLAIMDGEWTHAQIAGFLMGLRMKGETIDELAGFVTAMRARALTIAAPEDAVDTCGTGGDGLHTFNISTAAAIVAAAAGVNVAKHGNRSVSSKCGSADVLQALGVNINLSPEQAELCLQETGLTFLFAPIHHASMKHAALPRKEIGIRTAFNVLGPMSNPANTRRQVIGSFNRETAAKMVRVLQKLGSTHVLLIHSHDGMDEFSLKAPTHVDELLGGEIRSYDVHPQELGLNMATADCMSGAEAGENARIIQQVLAGETHAEEQVTVLNAGAAIYVAGQAASLQEGMEKARTSIHNGTAAEKLAEWIKYTQQFTN